MSPVSQALLTTSLTVLGGILVFVVGQVFSKLALGPVSELRALIGEIADDLLFYSNVYCNPGTGPDEIASECSRVLRQRASQLSARVHGVPFYDLCARLGLIPSLSSVVTARNGLIFLSNSVRNGEPRENDQRRTAVQNALGVPEELR
jgi:hypothetical protein